MSSPITIWNRTKSAVETEQVYADLWVRMLYQTTAGQKFADRFLSRHLPSRLYGIYQSSRFSHHKIHSFINEFNIPMEEFEKTSYQSFNDFFIRKFKPGLRPFVNAPTQMPAFAEARYLGFDKITAEQTFPVKGTALSAAELLGSAEKAAPFMGGPLLLARLCPTDYHRFHFPDDGEFSDYYRLPGRLHSVNPLALRYKSEIFATNERQVSLLNTKNFGKVAYVEVGALCVGKIVQTHPTFGAFNRGEEKGYFLFGASTVIVLGEPGAWKPEEELLRQTSQYRRESLVRLGECVAVRL